MAIPRLRASGAPLGMTSNALPATRSPKGGLFATPSRSVTSERVTSQRLRMQCAEPFAIASDPDRCVVRVDRQHLSIHHDALVHLIGDDRHVVADEPYLSVLFIERILLQLPITFDGQLLHRRAVDG